MDLKIKNFYLLIKAIRKNFKKKIIITSGGYKIKDLNLIINKYFLKIDKNTYISKKFKKDLIFVDNTSFRQLETIVKKSSFVICCEGAISHVSNAFNIKTIALVNTPGINTALFWTNHMDKIKLFRKN